MGFSCEESAEDLRSNLYENTEAFIAVNLINESYLKFDFLMVNRNLGPEQKT